MGSRLIKAVALLFLAAVSSAQNFINPQQPGYVSGSTVTISNPSGTSLSIQSSTTLHVSEMSDFFISASAGIIPGVTVLHKFGSNSACSTSEEGIHSLGGAIPFTSSADTVRVKAGGNANDTAAGTGARTIVVSGVDANFATSSETITLAGGSASASTTASFMRVTRAFVSGAGTYGAANAGDIIIQTTGGTDLIQIDASKGQSQTTLFTVPAGKTGYILGYQGNSSSAKPNTIKFFIRNSADDVTAPYSPYRIQSTRSELSGSFDEQFRVPLRVTEKTDIWATCLMTTGAGSADVEYDVVFYNN